MEGYTSVNGSAGNSAPVGGRRRSHKKLRLVKKRTVKRMLKKMGLKLRGGAGAAPEVTPAALASDGAATGVVAAPAGGRRRSRKHRKSHRRSRKVFGLF
jgi:type IV secretory pathway TrbL component